MDSQSKTRTDVNFGIHAASFNYPYIRVQNKTGTALPLTIRLTTPLVGVATNNAVLRAGEVVVKLPSGTVGQGTEAVDFTFDLLQKKYGTPGNEVEFLVDALTDATTVSTISGYSQQTVTFTVEKVA